MAPTTLHFSLQYHTSKQHSSLQYHASNPTNVSTVVSLPACLQVHRVELGRTYIRMGQVSKGVQQLEEATHMEIEELNAKLQLDDAWELLEEMRRKGHSVSSHALEGSSGNSSSSKPK